MAEIDKSLPNTKTEIEIPGEEVLIGAQEEEVVKQILLALIDLNGR